MQIRFQTVLVTFNRRGRRGINRVGNLVLEIDRTIRSTRIPIVRRDGITICSPTRRAPGTDFVVISLPEEGDDLSLQSWRAGCSERTARIGFTIQFAV